MPEHAKTVAFSMDTDTRRRSDSTPKLSNAVSPNWRGSSSLDLLKSSPNSPDLSELKRKLTEMQGERIAVVEEAIVQYRTLKTHLNLTDDCNNLYGRNYAEIKKRLDELMSERADMEKSYRNIEKKIINMDAMAEEAFGKFTDYEAEQNAWRESVSAELAEIRDYALNTSGSAPDIVTHSQTYNRLPDSDDNNERVGALPPGEEDTVTESTRKRRRLTKIECPDCINRDVTIRTLECEVAVRLQELNSLKNENDKLADIVVLSAKKTPSPSKLKNRNSSLTGTANVRRRLFDTDQLSTTGGTADGDSLVKRQSCVVRSDASALSALQSEKHVETEESPTRGVDTDKSPIRKRPSESTSRVLQLDKIVQADIPSRDKQKLACVTESFNALDSTFGDLLNEVKQTRIQNEQLKGEVALLQLELDDRPENSTDFKKANTLLTSEVQSLKRELGERDEQITTLGARLKQTTSTTRALDTENEKMLARFKEEAHHVHGLEKEQQALHLKLTQNERCMKDLREELSRSVANADKAAFRCTALETQLKRLNDTNEGSRRATERLKSENCELIEANNAVKREKEKYFSDLRKANEELQELEKNNHRLQSDIEVLKSRCSYQESVIHEREHEQRTKIQQLSLEMDVESARQTREIEKRMDDVATMQEEMSRQLSIISELQTQMAQLKSERSKSVRQLNDARLEGYRLERELEEQQRKRKQEKEAALAQHNELNLKQEELSKQLMSAKADYSRLDAEKAQVARDLEAERKKGLLAKLKDTFASPKESSDSDAGQRAHAATASPQRSVSAKDSVKQGTSTPMTSPASTSTQETKKASAHKPVSGRSMLAIPLSPHLEQRMSGSRKRQTVLDMQSSPSKRAAKETSSVTLPASPRSTELSSIMPPPAAPMPVLRDLRRLSLIANASRAAAGHSKESEGSSTICTTAPSTAAAASLDTVSLASESTIYDFPEFDAASLSQVPPVNGSCADGGSVSSYSIDGILSDSDDAPLGPSKC